MGNGYFEGKLKSAHSSYQHIKDQVTSDEIVSILNRFQRPSITKTSILLIGKLRPRELGDSFALVSYVDTMLEWNPSLLRLSHSIFY